MQDIKSDIIMSRLKEHLDAVKQKHPEWVGIFLYGSQNYGLDDEASDIDSKLIVLPSFEDFALNRKPNSYTHIMENNEHVDVKDIRLMFECFRKQNINFVEILFTKYRILNPKYEDSFQPVLNKREQIGRYHDFAALNCIVGTALQKQKALCHPYPTTKEKIDKYGFDSKQFHHILRLEEFYSRYLDGIPYEKCLISGQRERLTNIKKYIGYDLQYALNESERAVSFLQKRTNEYMEQHKVPSINREVDRLLNDTLLSLLKENFLREIGQ